MASRAGPLWSRLTRAMLRSFALVRAAAPRELKAVIALQAIGGLCLVAVLFLLRHLLRVVISSSGSGEVRHLVPELLGLAGATALGALATGLAAERQRFMVELVRRYAMEQILDVTTAADLWQFETAEFNDALSRARQHALIRPAQVVAGIIGVGQAVLTSLGLLITLVVIAPIMLPVLLLAVVPTTVLLRRNSRDLHDVDRQLTTTDRERWYLEDVLSSPAGAKETRTFRTHVLLRPMHRALAARRVDAYRVLIRRRSLRVAGAAVGGALVLVAGLAALSALVLTGHMSAADAATAAVVLQQLTSMLRSAGAGAGQVYENRLFLEEVDHFMSMAGRRTHRSTPPPSAPALHKLSIENVDFAYPGTTRPVLRDVSLEIEGGQVVALVGENGSGKTTLTKLICGLYEAHSGNVRWNGESMADVDPAEWRSRFAVLFQDFMRYELSARLNIAVGRHEDQHHLAGLRAAARLADADDFLTRLDDGYETVLSRSYAGGADLSLGQWQRLALARAFFSDAPVLILDEPTAALDPRVEQELLERVRALAGEKTIVVISHRLSSVRFVDSVFVLRDGALVEQGTHDDLMRLGGYYAELFELQASAYRTGAAVRDAVPLDSGEPFG